MSNFIFNDSSTTQNQVITANRVIDLAPKSYQILEMSEMQDARKYVNLFPELRIVDESFIDRFHAEGGTVNPNPITLDQTNKNAIPTTNVSCNINDDGDMIVSQKVSVYNSQNQLVTEIVINYNEDLNSFTVINRDGFEIKLVSKQAKNKEAVSQAIESETEDNQDLNRPVVKLDPVASVIENVKAQNKIVKK